MNPNMPKIDDLAYFQEVKNYESAHLHLHWDGSITADQLFAIAQKKGTVLLLPEKDGSGKKIKYGLQQERILDTPLKIHKFMTNLGGKTDTYSMKDIFDMTINFMQTEKDLQSRAITLCKYLQQQNTSYAEIRFAPQHHTRKGLKLDDVINISADAFKNCKDKTGVDARLIISLDRNTDPSKTEAVVDAAIRCNKNYPEYVVGLDLAGWEPGNPPWKHETQIKKGKRAGLKTTIHAGEMCDEKTNITYLEYTINNIEPNRISQALQLVKYPHLINLMVKKKIALESNPLSNLWFFQEQINDSIRNLWLDKLIEAGMCVTASADDPAMIPDGDLVHNLYHIGKTFGKEIAKEIKRNSIRAAWGLDEKQKKEYLLRM